MRIEKVTVKDAAALLDIYAPYVRETAVTYEYEVPTLKEFEHRITDISSKYPYLKAVDEGGEIVGYSYAGAFKTRRAYEWSVETTVYVKRDRHGEGTGRLLYEALEAELKSMGILNMNACIAYAPQEDEHLTNDSMYFHGKMGFKLVGTFHRCACKFGIWYDMIWMEKSIGEHVPNPPGVCFKDRTVQTCIRQAED